MLAIISILVSASFGWAQAPKSVCQKHGETVIIQAKGKDTKAPELLGICEQFGDGKDALQLRGISKGEINRMYTASRGMKDHTQKWLRFVDVKGDEAQLMTELKQLPQNDMVIWEDKDRSVLQEIGSLYQKHVSAVGGEPRVLNLVESDRARREMNDPGLVMVNCLMTNGSLVMSESAAGNGCYCGRNKYSNFVDLQCKGKELVVNSTSGGGRRSAASGQAR